MDLPELIKIYGAIKGCAESLKDERSSNDYVYTSNIAQIGIGEDELMIELLKKRITFLTSI